MGKPSKRRRKQFSVHWRDGNREPTCPPNPNFPKGLAVDMVVNEDRPACTVNVPYPAKRCGAYLIRCKRCGRHVAVTTAGRADDPISVRMNCASFSAPRPETVQ